MMHIIDNEEPEEKDRNFLPAVIFDLEHLFEKPPAGFDAVKIGLNGALDADLKWEKERAAAARYVEQGYRIFWEMQSGLFHDLRCPLSTETQLLSLSLALEHFYKTLWAEFKDHSIGICLYRGEADFSQGYPWDEEQESTLKEWLQANNEAALHSADLSCTTSGRRLLSLFCRDAGAEYLELLAKCLPDSIDHFLLLDVSRLRDPLTTAQLITQERFPLFKIAVKGGRFLGGEMEWEGDSLGSSGYIGRTSPKKEKMAEIKVGVCLPAPSIIDWIPELNHCLVQLLEKLTPFRIVPESYLTTGWDGLDVLHVSSPHMTAQGQRKLLGFAAAGGTTRGLCPLDPHQRAKGPLDSLP